jgi:hypothetical protein
LQRTLFFLGLALLMVTLILASGKVPAQAREHKTLVYDDPSMPICTIHPDTTKVEGGCGDEGCGFTFTFKVKGHALDRAKVHIFLPRGVTTATALESSVTGPKGLLKNAGWEKEPESQKTNKFNYEWVRKIINFSDPKNKGMVGNILLGEASGQAVEILLYYPREWSNDFLTSAHLILGNLSFRSDKLPLEKLH